MRIDRLDLIAFGPFTGVALDLAQGQQGLHVVYGENESGKSSALRAIGELLFGIDRNSTDDFVHGKTELRLGGSLRTRDGQSLAFVRRKGNQNVLLDPQSDAPLGDDALAPFLRGIDRGEFERVFGLDHERLRKNALALLDSGDGATAAIVGSGLGIPELRGVLSRLESDADGLWSPRARTKPINEDQALIRSLLQEVASLSVTGARWNELREAMQKAEHALAEAKRKKDEADQRRARLERVRRIREPVAARRAARERLPAGLIVPALDATFAERRSGAETALATGRAEQAAATERRDDLRRQLDAQPGDDPILASAAIVHELTGTAATVKKALADLEKRRTELAGRLADRDRFAAQLGIHVDESSITALRDRLDRGVTDPSLARAVRAAQQLGDVVEQRSRLTDRRESSLRRFAEALVRFRASSGYQGDADGLAVLVLPDAETVRRFAARFTTDDDGSRALESEQERLEAEARDAIAELDGLARDGELPAESALRESRALRDDLWRLVRRAWQKGEDVGAAAAALDAEHALPEAFEHATGRADRIADLLRAESKRVAKAAELLRTADKLRARIDDVARKRSALADSRAALDAEWTALARDAGLRVLPPERLREVIALRDELLGLRDDQRTTDSDRAAFEARVAAATGALARALPHPAATDLDYAVALERAEAALESAQHAESAGTKLLAAHDAVVDLEHRIAAIRGDAAQFAQDVADLVARCAADLNDREPGKAVAELAQRVQIARDARTRRETLTKEAATLDEKVAACAIRQQEARRQLDDLCREAGVTDASLLPAVEDHARAERELRREGRPEDLDALVTAHEGDDVIAELATIEETLQATGREVDACTAALLESRRAFLAIDGAPAAAQKAEEIAQRRAALRGKVEDYLRKAFAARLLAGGLERYREQHATPVLALAGRHLSSLTRGRYVAVQTDVDDHGKPVVRVRAANERRELEVDRLSDGTRDQLCLSLVLGSLEHRFAHTEPMPVVLDDVLVHFDDERSLAALDALADFARTTQVLLFTHHGRIRDQALGLGPTHGVFIHRLHA
ncbi:MAG: AAA family ATPase [Planctomycetes bacterium]|nr:AAA family ATPase [Planctomycetota bacterium]